MRPISLYPAAAIAEVEGVAFGMPVYAVSATEGRGLDVLQPHLRPGETVALLGSSGVKSTLINALLGKERLATGAVREGDHRGRHTTVHRELVLLPSGAILLDTPGMRSLSLWSDGSGLGDAFDDIEALAAQCRFADCSHREEPGCAVRAAIASGDLDPARLESYRKLERELRHLASRQDDRLRMAERDRGKRLSRMQKDRSVLKDKGWVR